MTKRPVITKEQETKLLDYMDEHKGRYQSISEILREAIDNWLKRKKLEEKHFEITVESEIE